MGLEETIAIEGGSAPGVEREDSPVLIARARSWLQLATEAISEHRALILDPVPEGLSSINEARRSVQLARLTRSIRDARDHVRATVAALLAPGLAPEDEVTVDAIELAASEVDAYLSKLPLPPL